MTGLNGANGTGNRSDPWDSRMDPGQGRYNHARQESIGSDGGTLENPYDDPSGAPAPEPSVVPSRQPTLANRNQYDAYSDPYYKQA